jgi:hypothetical protein
MNSTPVRGMFDGSSIVLIEPTTGGRGRMIRVDKGRIAPGCLMALILVCSETVLAESLSCAAQSASGFVYDKQSESWQVSSLPVDDRKYRVRPANEGDLIASALKYDYEIIAAGSSKPVIRCKTVRLPDSNEETGLILCKGSLGASFNIDTRTGRYIRSQPAGYMTWQASTESSAGPYMEIGNCSPE